MQYKSGTGGGRVEPDYIVNRSSYESARKWAVAFGKKMVSFRGIEEPSKEVKENKRTRNRRRYCK